MKIFSQHISSTRLLSESKPHLIKSAKAWMSRLSALAVLIDNLVDSCSATANYLDTSELNHIHMTNPTLVPL